MSYDTFTFTTVTVRDGNYISLDGDGEAYIDEDGDFDAEERLGARDGDTLVRCESGGYQTWTSYMFLIRNDGDVPSLAIASGHTRHHMQGSEFGNQPEALSAFKAMELCRALRSKFPASFANAQKAWLRAVREDRKAALSDLQRKVGRRGVSVIAPQAYFAPGITPVTLVGRLGSASMADDRELPTLLARIGG